MCNIDDIIKMHTNSVNISVVQVVFIIQHLGFALHHEHFNSVYVGLWF